MNTVIDILESLEAIGSRLDKEAILSRNKHNELLKQVFVAAQDPYTVYYVNKFPMPKEPISLVPIDDDVLLSRFLDAITTKLATRELTGNTAKEFVVGMFKAMTLSQQKWCQRILLKNLRCGVQEATVNKTWPGTLKKFSVSLAETLKSSHDKEKGIQLLEPVKYPVRVEPKLDGLRCIAVKHNGVVTLYTRNGTVLETLPRIKSALEEAHGIDDIVLDGEALSIDGDWNTSASVVMSHKNNKNDALIAYHVFDAIPYQDWINQSNNDPFAIRIENVIKILDQLPIGTTPYIKRVQGDYVANEAELMEFYSMAMNDGHEGIMIKNCSAPYRFKRSDAILKLKPTMTHELMIIGSYEGRRGTKREGLFGGFEAVASNGVVTRVGGGFSDGLKAEIQLIGPASYVGKIIECECQPDPMTKDGLTVEGKLRFPVFCRFRNQNDVDPQLIDVGQHYLKSISAKNS